MVAEELHTHPAEELGFRTVPDFRIAVASNLAGRTAVEVATDNRRIAAAEERRIAVGRSPDCTDRNQTCL